MTENKTLTEAEKEFARSLVRQIPFVKLLDIELVDIEPGAATCRLAVAEKHTRQAAFLHGGATASLIDTAMAFAIGALLGSPANAVTVDLSVHYLRPIRQTATATARILRDGKRLLTAQCDVFNEDNALAATALATYSRINGAK